MSLTTSPTLRALRHVYGNAGEIGRYADNLTASLIRAQQHLKEQFMAAAYRGDMAALATWAPMVNDRSIPATTDGFRAKRYQTVGEVFADAMDMGGGAPDQIAVVGLLCAVAFGDEPKKAAARVLIDGMANAWAKHNAEAEA